MYEERISKKYGQKSTMTKCLTMNNGTSLGSSTAYGMNLSFMPRQHVIGISNKSRSIICLPRPCFKVSTKHGGRGMFFVGGTIYILNGIGNGNVAR